MGPKLLPDRDPLFQHRMAGSDDMQANLRTVLTDSSLSVQLVQDAAG